MLLLIVAFLFLWFRLILWSVIGLVVHLIVFEICLAVDINFYLYYMVLCCRLSFCLDFSWYSLYHLSLLRRLPCIIWTKYFLFVKLLSCCLRFSCLDAFVWYGIFFIEASLWVFHLEYIWFAVLDKPRNTATFHLVLIEIISLLWLALWMLERLHIFPW